MTDSDPPAGSGGHAWQRLREQRAKDLGEDPGPDPTDDDPREDGTDSGSETDEPEKDR